MTDQSLIIGSTTSQFLRVTPLRRTHPACSDYWDGNWIDSLVDVSVGAFTGKYTACLRTDEFKAFRVALENLYRTAKSDSSFTSMEEWIEVQVIGDGLGHFEAQCTLRDAAGIGNTSRFNLDFDQTEIPVMLKSLHSIEESFPVVGLPPS